MSEKKIFFFDVDNTLLPNVEGQESQGLTEKTIYAIEKLKEKYPVFIATGKSEKMIQSEQKILNIDNLITTNGQKIRRNKEVFYANEINHEDIKKWTDLALAAGLMVGFQGEMETYFLEENEDKEKLTTEFSRLHLPYPVIKKEFEEDSIVYQLLIIGDREKMRKINVEGYKIFTWGDEGHDILPIYADKEYAIKKVVKMYPEHQVYTFGDGTNDVAMIKYADVGVAMGNAVPAVKEVADFITDRVEEDGVYNFLVKENLI